MDAIRLKAHGMLHKEIAEVIGISENTLRDYFELYEQGGVEKLKEINYYTLRGHKLRFLKELKT